MGYVWLVCILPGAAQSVKYRDAIELIAPAYRYAKRTANFGEWE